MFGVLPAVLVAVVLVLLFSFERSLARLINPASTAHALSEFLRR
ncbi:hypothetical protein ACIBI9_67850 [Nonomuraea sp. NPDC050451]